MATFMVAVVAPLCAFAMEDFRIGIYTSDGNQGENTGSIEYTPWAIQDNDGWCTFASDSNFNGPDGLKIGIQTDDLGNGDGYIADTDFRLMLQTCSGPAGSVSACSSDTSDVQYTPWASEVSGYGDYSGWASKQSVMNGWRVGIQTKESKGLRFTDIQVGVQLEYTTVGDLQTTQSVGGVVAPTTSWSEWAYNANKNNHAIDQVRLFLNVEVDAVGVRLLAVEERLDSLERTMKGFYETLLVEQSVSTPVGFGVYADYALYALALANLVVLLCLFAFCMVRRVPTKVQYGRVYDTEMETDKL